MIETFSGGLLKSAMEKDNPEYVKLTGGLLGKSNAADQLAQSAVQSQNQLIQAETGAQHQMAQQMAQTQQEAQQRQAQEKAKQQQLLSLGIMAATGGFGGLGGAEGAAAAEGSAAAEGAEVLNGTQLAADAEAMSSNMWDKFLGTGNNGTAMSGGMNAATDFANGVNAAGDVSKIANTANAAKTSKGFLGDFGKQTADFFNKNDIGKFIKGRVANNILFGR